MLEQIIATLSLVVSTIGFTFGLFLLLVYSHTRYGMYLHAALSSLLCGLYFLASSEVFLRFASPEAGNILMHLGMNFCYFLYRFSQYFHVATPRLNRWFAVLLLLVSVPLGLMLIQLNADLLQPLRAIHHVLVLIVGAPALYMVAQGMRQGRAGAAILLLGFTLSFAFGLNDVLLALGVIDSMLLMPLGVCAGLGAMLYVTSNSFATIFSEKKKLLATLQEKNTALQTEQARVSFILNMVPDLFTVSRLADGHIVTVNEGFTRLSGWPAEEVIGRNANELGLWPPEARKNFVRKLAETGSLSDFESTFTTKDGNQIPGLVSARTFAIDGVAHIAMNVRDISESHKQEDALRRSYDLLAKIQQNAGMGIWQWNLDSGEIWFSQTAYDILRLSAKPTPGLPPGFVGIMRAQDSINMVHPDDRERYIHEFATGLRTRQVRSYQYRAVCGDGVVRVLYTEGFLELNETGRILHFYGFLQDITERVTAEQALRTSEEKLTAIYNAIPDQVAITRLCDAVLVDINEESSRAYGRPRAEMIGISFADSDFWNDKADFQRLASILVSTGKVDAFECTVRTHAGECYRGSISSRLFTIADQVHVISICRDVTELYRKQTELQRSYDMMAQIQQHAGMGIWQWNPETDEVFCSKISFDLYQYTPQQARALPPGFSGLITGKQTLDFVYADDWGHYLDSLSVLLQDKQPRVLNYRIRRGDGMLRTLHSQSHAEVDANGKVLFLYGFIKDITEEQRVAGELAQHRNHLEILVKQRTTELQSSYAALSQANQNLRAATAAAEAAQHAAEAASRMKSEFLAMISHEIRTPLGGVIGMIKLGLKDTHIITETRSKFDLGLSNAESLLQIINDILDYSKLEAGRLTLERIDFDLPAVLQDSHSILEERADAKGLALIMEQPPELPRWWLGDPVRLRQVLINLMGNAIKFTEHGSVLLTLNQEEDGWLEFAVADSGVGIPAEALPRLFQKFEQADVSTTRKFGGTGLGLAICKHIVEAMGGTIGVTSTLGAGTTFRFRLPLQEGKKPETVETVTSSRHTHRLSILCAEDGKTNQIIVRELVESMGHRMDLAENGLEAVRALSMRRYDMVLMDMRMPEMDGMEATQLIRAGGNERYIVLDPSLPIIALTANVMEEDRQRYLQAGMDGFLGKPIDEAALFAEFAKVITRLLAQGAALPPLAAVEDAPAPTSDVATLDALFGVDNTATLPPPDPVAAVQAVLSTRPSVSQRTWNAMIEVFRSEAPQRLARLKTALDVGDATSAALELHTLKGSAAYLQGLEVRALCATLENLANQNDLQSVARRHNELEQTLRAMLASLQPH
ncbi:MAG: PAS domain S-box protein [Rhodoferax sp.]|nr:PAS domain S-box protein [Rhodoferax sp.]